MYTHVIFDLDGTLLDTLGDLALACNHALSAMGLPTHPVQAYRKMVGNGIDMLITRMLPETGQGKSTHQVARGLFDSYYEKHMQDLTAPYAGITDMLDALARAGVRMGVASNKDDALAVPIVERYFPGVFFGVMGLRPEYAPKPDPTGMLELARQMSAQSHNTLYVGDSDVDMQTARSAHLPCCGVTWGFRDADELKNAGATFLVDRPEQIVSLVLD